MDSFFADFMATMGRFCEERLTALADERAAEAVKNRLTKADLADYATMDILNSGLRAILDEAATKRALADAIEPLATAEAVNANIEAAKNQAIAAATNGRPNRSELKAAIAQLRAELIARIDALTPPVES
jgi:hypothetical protein